MNQKNAVQNKFKILSHKLVHFGLNPNDWFISELPNGLFVIQNLLENDMTLLGKAIYSKSWDWKNIQLAEI